MNKILLKVFTITSLLLLSACHQQIKGNGNPQTATRTVEPFKIVRVFGEYQVNVKVGQPPQVSITTDGNLIPYIVTRVHGKTLDINTKARYSILANQPPVINIVTNNLEGISVIGNGSITASDIKSDDFILKLVGSGNANLSGQVEDFEIQLLGSGSISANNLISKNVDVRLAGSGNASIYGTNKLNIKVSGNGKVQYHGNPVEIDQKIAGSGEVSGTSTSANVKKN